MVVIAGDLQLEDERSSFHISIPKVATVRSKSLFAMNRLWVFAIGFAVGLLIFVTANVISYRQMLRGTVLADAPREYGFPFEFHAIRPAPLRNLRIKATHQRVRFKRVFGGPIRRK